MTNERAYQRFLAVLNLARRPGTPEEGEAAMNMARKMAEKYGFDLNDQSVADPAEQKKAREVVRKWKQYQGDKKKDMKEVFKLARFAGYTVDGNRILVSPNELNAVNDAFAMYRNGRMQARKVYKRINGSNEGCSKLWDAMLQYYLANGTTKMIDPFDIFGLAVFNEVVSALYKGKES